jgi:hypothetical protein
MPIRGVWRQNLLLLILETTVEYDAGDIQTENLGEGGLYGIDA